MGQELIINVLALIVDYFHNLDIVIFFVKSKQLWKVKTEK